MFTFRNNIVFLYDYSSFWGVMAEVMTLIQEAYSENGYSISDEIVRNFFV